MEAASRGGAVTGTRKHNAFGASRGATGALPTERASTGQPHDASGLIYMNARYYDPAIGQFARPDTVVPDSTVVMDYNRYMYARANPLKYNDPTGHNGVAVHDSNDGPLPDWTKWGEILDQSQLDGEILQWMQNHQNLPEIEAMMGLLESYYQGAQIVPASFEQIYAWAYSSGELPNLWDEQRSVCVKDFETAFEKG